MSTYQPVILPITDIARFRRTILPAIAVYFILFIVITAGLLPGKAYASGLAGTDDHGLHVYFISGSNEYQLEAYFSALMEELKNDFRGIRVTVSWAEDAGVVLPGIESLADAERMVVFSRRITVPGAKLKYIFQHLEAEKLVIGLRTASHAFQNFLEFDQEILGGNYSGHGDDEPTEITIDEGAEDHSVLIGVTPWFRYGKIYRNPDLTDLSPETENLLYVEGLRSGLHYPIAWIRRYGENGRDFYTSMPVLASSGRPTGDFENKNYRQLLYNAIEWATGHELKRNSLNSVKVQEPDK